MGQTAVTPRGILQVAANSILGNSTGSVGRAESLSESDVRTLLVLATTDAVVFAGGTFNGDVLVAGDNGTGSYGGQTTALEVQAGKHFFDVGLRIVTDSNPDSGSPNYPYGSFSALDLDLRSTGVIGGDAMRIFTNAGGTRSKAVYFNSAGALYTRVGLIVSGAFALSGTNDGEDTIIQPPTNDQTMIGVWGDVIGGVQVRAANVVGPWLWEGLDRNAVLTSKIWEDGSAELANITTGAGSSSSPSIRLGTDLDSGFYQVASGTLSYSSGGVCRWLASGNTGITPSKSLRIDDDMGIGWSTNPDGVADEFLLCRDSANTLRLKAGGGSATDPSLIIDGTIFPRAGTAAAGTSPIKLTAGTNLTTPENGAIEFDGTNLYITIGGTRRTIQVA